MDLKNITSGIYNISNEEYHSLNPITAISRSQIMTFKKSPLHFWHQYINPHYVKPKPTHSMIFGSALHCYILEEILFKRQFSIKQNREPLPKQPLLKEVGRKAYDEARLEIDNIKKKYDQLDCLFEINSKNKTIISFEDYEKILMITDQMRKRENEKGLLFGGINEKSIFWIDQESGIICKARPDIFHENMVVDLKTTADASFNSCRNSIYKYGYHIQAAMILDGIKQATGKELDTFVFVFVEKEPPYASGVYILDADSIELGRSDYKRQLLKLKECFNKNEWPSYENSIINLPGYADFEF